MAKCHNDESMARCSSCKSNFSISYDGVGALSSHSNSNKHKQTIKSISATKRMHIFFNPQGSSQSDKVNVAELTHVYHSVSHHISYLAQDCSVKVMKVIADDSEIVKKMTAGCTKASALVNMVLHPFAVETVLEKLKDGLKGIPFSV